MDNAQPSKVLIPVRPDGAGRLIIRLPYSPERVAKIKTIPGRCGSVRRTD